MASKRPHQLGGTDETKKTRQDEAEASVTGADAGPHMGDDSDVHVNASAQDGGNVNAPAFSQNTFHGSFKYNPSVHHHYGAATSTSAPQPAHRSDTASIIAEYKTSVQSSYEEVKEYNSRPCENVLLSKRYTELHMVESHRKPEEREEEIRSRGERLQDILKRRSSEAYITVENLFRPDSRRRVPKAVILQGHPGYGKSFTAQKIMLDWASGTLYKDLCHLVLHLECKEINEVSGECSLVDLLNYSPSFTSDTEDVLRDPKIKVLFLVDGFDELKFSLEGTSSALPKDPFTKVPVEATLKALLKGHILPQCKLLLTTRSTATSTLSCLVTDHCFQRFVDILGFTEEGVKDYFHRFFQNEHKADTLFEYVRANETLYTSCFIPVICWVTCTVFQAQELKGAHTIAETNTSIIANFVSILLKHHSLSLRLSEFVLLSSLGRLAEKGLKEKCVLFTKKDVLSTVSDPKTTVSPLKKGPLLCELSCKRVFKTEEMFSFMHLSLQEFFAALHYTLDEEGEKRLPSLLNSQEHWESQREPVIQFLFGLANKEMRNLEYLQSTPYISSIRSHLEKWVLEKIADHKLVQSRLMFILYCLHELHEEEFVGKAMHGLAMLSFECIPLTRMDFWVLRYCLLCCPTIKKLKLSECEMTAEMLRMLQPALSRCQDLSLDLEAVDDDDIWTFLSTLMKGHKLKKLSLTALKDSLEDVGEFISSLADKHILRGQRFKLCLYFMSGRTKILLPEASQSIEHLKTVGKAHRSVYNWRTDQIDEDSNPCGVSYALIIGSPLTAGKVNAHETRMSHDEEITGASSESSEEAGLDDSQEAGWDDSQEAGWDDSQEAGLDDSQEAGLDDSQEAGWDDSQEAGLDDSEEDDNNPLKGFKHACSEFVGPDSDDEYLDADYNLDELFSYLVRIPGLKEVKMQLERCLNNSWESDVLSLVNRHPTLQRIRLKFKYIDEHMMEQIKEIKIKRPDCTVIIKGVRRVGHSIQEAVFDETYIFRKNFVSCHVVMKELPSSLNCF